MKPLTITFIEDYNWSFEQPLLSLYSAHIRLLKVNVPTFSTKSELNIIHD